MNAVIYARYSSDNQREESIEGQIRECTAYAERNGITVVRHYIDRALSAKTDNRPDFQQMIRDSNKKLFEIVLVWKFDRFARNRFDSANYKMILKKNNVHLISVMEPIAEGSQGILVETLLEGMAEYYSAELSEKVIRGQTENALKGKCTGGTGTIGYKIDEEKFYRIDPLVAPFVLEAFQRYDNGEKIVEILNYLNEKGVRNMLGGKLTCSSMNTMLKNRRYIGELSFRDTVVPDAIPAIVPKDLFDRVQKRLEKNKRAPARGKADEEYLLTTKLFCGKCGALMFGESGTSATGRTYYYYKCATAKRRKGCNKKTVQKDWLESLVVQETMKLIQDDAMIERIVQLVMDFQNQENTTIPLLEKQLREVDRKLDNLMKAIEEGLFTRTTKERLDALEAQKDELTAKIADEKLRKPSFNADFIRFWLMKFRKFDISQQKQRKALIEIFVNAILLYDDRMLITFNYKDGSQTIRFEDALTAAEAVGNSSDLSSSARPQKSHDEASENDAHRGFLHLHRRFSMIRDICKDELFLARKAAPASPEDLPIAQDLLETLIAHKDGCVGMAANMIGTAKRIIAVEGEDGYLVMFNPVILKKSGPYETEEGCLSLTDTRKTKRFQTIKVQWQNEKFQTRIKTFTGWTAEILQHEIDHCDGIII